MGKHTAPNADGWMSPDNGASTSWDEEYVREYAKHLKRGAHSDTYHDVWAGNRDTDKFWAKGE